uniref:Uncharacterized protein n=1 Tax=Rhizophora mucronata TaxID=61149 RepID=A0A2P2Q5B6_RHIMU
MSHDVPWNVTVASSKFSKFAPGIAPSRQRSLSMHLPLRLAPTQTNKRFSSTMSSLSMVHWTNYRWLAGCLSKCPKET